LPVWLLLAPRDYLSTFMKLGTICALALGIFLVLPDLKMPAISQFVDGSGPVVSGKVFPFCFIVIACGAISGFHTLIASGTTPKILTRESYARPIGYGAMCLESLVAIMALIAACTLEPGVYLSMNMKGEAAATVAKVTALGFPVTVEHMNQLAQQLGEKTLFGRTGGAATLAVGMAQIFSRAVSNRWLDLWYHFAIMFEALFILTTLDAGTRVGRYLIQDVLGSIWKPMGETRSLRANITASLLVVAGWGYFLIQGVRDPLGGINSLWPLFGIANQLLAAIALCLGTTIILKMSLAPAAAEISSPAGKPWFALVTFVPLLWLLAVTMTAGSAKIFSADPQVGFLAQARVLDDKLPALQEAVSTAKDAGDLAGAVAAAKALHTNRVLRFNNILDATVAGSFLVLVGAIALLSLREWILLLGRRKLAVLKESEPVWLPEYTVSDTNPVPVAGLIALAFALAKELSGEAHIERAQAQEHLVATGPISPDRGTSRPAAAENGKNATNVLQAPLAPKPAAGRDVPRSGKSKKHYLAMTEHRFNGVKRCC
ncbi:MAG TPA: carbon starvation CstA family protein, partial [Candidatus Dormibacteraeota bacterium]|nr:carbon starvation CstA family protein [Candidatus Dormibacteraeota bacterium]